MEKEQKIFFADIEAYSLKYFKKNNSVKEYIVGSKEYHLDRTIKPREYIQTNIKDYIKEFFKDNKCNTATYLHNSGGYDGHFLLPILKGMFGKTKVSVLMDDKATLYEVKVEQRARITQPNGKVKMIKYYHRFIDSQKIWPLPLAVIGEVVGLSKLDYGEYDILDTFATVEDYKKHNGGKSYEYFMRDIDILIEFARQTEDVLPLSQYKLTIASTAMSLWKKSNEGTGKGMNWWLKYKDSKGVMNQNNTVVWDITKRAYKGGITYVNPAYQLKDLRKIYVYDINSMYPAIMLNKKLPYGNPSFKEEDKAFTYKMYKVHITYAKAKGMPFIALPKDDSKHIIELHGVLHNNDELEHDEAYPLELKNVTVFMNNYTFAAFEKYYDGECHKEFQFSFREKFDMFKKYINDYKIIKESSSGGRKQLAKFFLNSLYGKLAQDIRNITGEVVHIDDIRSQLVFKEKQVLFNGKIVHINGDYVYIKEDKGLKSTYSFIPMSEAITSHARIQLVETIMLNWKNFVYCDTDSIHLLAPAVGITLDDNNFGDWAFEGVWDRAIYRRPKHYYHLNDDYYELTDAKLKKAAYEIKGGGFQVKDANPDNLPMSKYIQTTFLFENGKLGKKIVNGGVLLYSMDYVFNMPSKWVANNVR